MTNTKFFLLASACVFLNSNAQALEVKNLTFDYSDSPLVNTHIHTSHTPYELKPISSFNSDNAVKLASVCSITGCNRLNFDSSDNKIDFDNAHLCNEDGYTLSSCPENYIKGAACPLDSKYIKECISPETWCKNNGYAVTECTLPAYPETVCPHSSAYYKSCKPDNVRACKEEGYSLVCDTGKVRDDNQICSYDDSYSKCVCNPCIGFKYTIAQASEQGYEPGEICNSCGTIKYKREENACEGYKTCDCGGEVGADVCYSGTQQKFSTCKECCDTSVYKYDASNCSGDYQLSGNSCGGKFDKCQKKCKIGDVLYEDKKCYEIGTTDKTPIAIVFDEEKKLAAALFDYSPTGHYRLNYHWTDKLNLDYYVGDREEMIEYGTEYNYGMGKDILQLENCKGNTESEWLLSCPTDGKANTAAIIAFGKAKNISYPAAKYCNDYVTPGTNAGDWFLPSYAQMKSIYNAKDKLEKAAKQLGKMTEIYSSTFQTSSELSDSLYLRLQMSDGQGFSTLKYNSHYVMPVLYYGECTDYTITSCSGIKVPGGGSCGGRHKTCVCPAEYYKTCTLGLLEPDPDDLGCDGFYSRCINERKTCEDFGYLTPGSEEACACKYGNIYQSVETYRNGTLHCVKCPETKAECIASDSCYSCDTIQNNCYGGEEGSTCSCGGGAVHETKSGFHRCIDTIKDFPRISILPTP